MPGTISRTCSAWSCLGRCRDGRASPTPRFTYGLKKASILPALVNSLFLLVAVGAIGAEAVRRLFHPSPTEGEL